MKKYINSLTSLLVLVAVLLSVVVPVGAASGTQPSKYSSTVNSGTRHVVCTTLDGTTAAGYYKGNYTYEKLAAQSASTLLQSLRTLMKTGHKATSYSDCKNYADKMDCQNESGKMTSIYTSYVTNYNASTINREHVWPKSLGGFETSGAGSDLHHIRPSEITPNSNRGNLKYGNVTGGSTSIGNASGKEAGTYNSSFFEPLDNVKGDVARICLYVYARYGGELSKCSNITNVFQSVDVLLEWCEIDPVDTWEMGRNEVVYAKQGNRNVFIDYPELAWKLFGKSVPSDMQTPSGKAMGNGGSGSGSTCAHTSTEISNKVDATCTEGGYTGDKYCTDCGELVEAGSTTSKLGHRHTEIIGAVDANCGEAGYTGDTKCTDCNKIIANGSTIPATGEHAWGIVTTITPPTADESGVGQKTCSTCGTTKRVTIPALGAGGDTPVIPDEPDTPDTPDTPDAPGEGEAVLDLNELLLSLDEAERVVILLNLAAFESALYEMLAR